MRVAVVGGTGVLGARVVAELAARGDDVRVLSRGPRQSRVDAEIEHRPVDLASGEGLAEAVAGTEVVIDAANALRQAKQVLVEGTGRLLAAEAEAGVAHHVAISIVGCDRVPTSYYATKVAQEGAVEAGTVPWSLIRATQFHQLIAGAFASAARFRVAPTGAALLQPIEPGAVARRVADLAHAGPSGRVGDVGGPELLSLTELSATWRRHAAHRLLPLRVPMLGRLGRSLRDGGLCNREAAVESKTFDRWLADE